MISESRKPKAERNPKAEIRNQKRAAFMDLHFKFGLHAECRTEPNPLRCDSRVQPGFPAWFRSASDFEFRPSFGFRISDFGFSHHAAA